MYIFRALIFVGIISLTTCRPEIQSASELEEQQWINILLNYPDFPPKQEFNVTAYFRDVWHVVSRFSPKMPSNESEDKTECMKFTSQILENGNVRQIFIGLSERMPNSYVESIINLTEFQNGVGKFLAETRPDGKPKLPIYPVRTTIIDTDYSNYSVEYKCIYFGKNVQCVYLILNRKPYVLDPNVETILNKLELKLQDFTLLKKPDCAEA